MAFENCDSVTKFIYSHFGGYDDYGNPLFDRALTDEQWAHIETAKLKDGIFYNDANFYKVELYGSLQVVVRAGISQIRGRESYLPEDIILNVETGDSTDRVDRVVLQLNLTDSIRDVRVLIKKGSTELIRTVDIWELGLADITVRRNTSVITEADILDLRLDTDACGIVDYIYKLDTKEYFTQFDFIITEMVNTWAEAADAFEEFQRQRLEDIDFDFTAWRNLIAAMETQTFHLINNNFDDWSTKRGCTKTIVFTKNAATDRVERINEVLKVVSENFTLADKITLFNADGSITETITFYPWEIIEGLNTFATTNFKITKTTTFNADGSISEVIL